MAGEGLPADEAARSGDYRAARIGAAAGLVGVIVVLSIVDALSTAYTLDLATLGVLLATVLTLLGLEAGKFIRGGK